MAMAVSSIGNHLFNTVQLTAVSVLTVAMSACASEKEGEKNQYLLQGMKFIELNAHFRSLRLFHHICI